MENEKYLTEQLITYIGNKRALLSFIGESIVNIKKELGLEKLITFDGFAGSGVVSRYLKQYSSKVYSNDLESYSYLVTDAYLTNSSEIDFNVLNEFIGYLNREKFTTKFGNGLIEKLYSPKNTFDIKENERCFFTNENAKIIDNIRRLIDEYPISKKYKDLVLANLIHKVSVHTNTSGVFKGFYKSKNTGVGRFGGDGENALSRIMGEIELEVNILSDYETQYEVFNEDINEVIKKIPKTHLNYYDPPYNQHPYGSNYHILNTVHSYLEPKNISKVSGIPKDWNKSEYNYKNKAENSIESLIKNSNTDFILISYNNEGIITEDKMYEILSSYGVVEVKKKVYNTFKGSRNLSKRTNKVDEILYVLKKT
jgi:adenine-specific DNA-methyltransferase